MLSDQQRGDGNVLDDKRRGGDYFVQHQVLVECHETHLLVLGEGGLFPLGVVDDEQEVVEEFRGF